MSESPNECHVTHGHVANGETAKIFQDFLKNLIKETTIQCILKSSKNPVIKKI